jgi:hypothetical protein
MALKPGRLSRPLEPLMPSSRYTATFSCPERAATGTVQRLDRGRAHSFRRTPRRSVAVFAVSLEKPAIKKPFGCRVAVVLQPSSRPMREDYIPCSAGPPSMRQREKPLGMSWRK